MVKKRTRKNGGDFPTLMSAKRYANHIGKSYPWVKKACLDGRILASQLVGGLWVIAADSLIVPRGLEGFPNVWYDMDLPEEFVLGQTTDEGVPVPEYVRGRPEGSKNTQPLLIVYSFAHIAEENGWTIDYIVQKTGVSRPTVVNAKQCKPLTPKTVVKLSTGLAVPISDLLRYREEEDA